MWFKDINTKQRSKKLYRPLRKQCLPLVQELPESVDILRPFLSLRCGSPKQSFDREPGIQLIEHIQRFLLHRHLSNSIQLDALDTRQQINREAILEELGDRSIIAVVAVKAQFKFILPRNVFIAGTATESKPVAQSAKVGEVICVFATYKWGDGVEVEVFVLVELVLLVSDQLTKYQEGCRKHGFLPGWNYYRIHLPDGLPCTHNSAVVLRRP